MPNRMRQLERHDGKDIRWTRRQVLDKPRRTQRENSRTGSNIMITSVLCDAKCPRRSSTLPLGCFQIERGHRVRLQTQKNRVGWVDCLTVLPNQSAAGHATCESSGAFGYFRESGCWHTTGIFSDGAKEFERTRLFLFPAEEMSLVLDISVRICQAVTNAMHVLHAKRTPCSCQSLTCLQWTLWSSISTAAIVEWNGEAHDSPNDQLVRSYYTPQVPPLPMGSDAKEPNRGSNHGRDFVPVDSKKQWKLHPGPKIQIPALSPTLTQHVSGRIGGGSSFCVPFNTSITV